VKQNKDGQVIVTEEGESLLHDPRIPTENIGHPVHTWRSKAFELTRVSERRRVILRKLVVQRNAARRLAATNIKAMNELLADDFRGFW
jgi:hypothetical protein